MAHEIKAYILEKLREAEGEWVSGEVLRAPFGVSRMAVSKQVRVLRERGFGIETGTRKGYRLVSEAEGLYPELVLPLLQGTRFASAGYRALESTASTNDDIRELAEAGAPEGWVVTAEAQRAGRGRRGRSWFGQRGDSLMVSLLLRPPISPSRCGLLPLLTAVAAREALAEQGVEGVGIKWPNDLILDGRKLAGILCEISSDFDAVSHAVIGLGMNVNTAAADFPGAVRGVACSLRMVTGRTWSRLEILAGYLRQMDGYLCEAWRGDFGRMLADWRAASVTLGRSIEVTLPDGSRLQGLARDLDDSGALVFETRRGEIRHLTGGEVSLGLQPFE